ncbi:hypothetical protein [Enterovirga rhinocerotis]|uniref:hypothetical protein n=1 Tax=Enterovirga rhinocerotis TaxID=1339210 RepID=UPI00105E54FA|nr:hypothetical protein [Enterovirga rhinocerotis]
MAYVDSVEASATAPREPVDAFGPIYPALNATVAKGRRVADPTREQRRAHGEAVGAAIRELQRRELQREAPPHRCPCASGTWHSGDDLTKAIRRQHDAALQAQAKADRARRTDAQVMAQYEAAMAERRAQEAALAAGGGRIAESEAARPVKSSARGRDPMEAAVMKADPALLRDVLRREPAGRLRDLAAARLVELEAGPGPVAASDEPAPALQVGRENRNGSVAAGDASDAAPRGTIEKAEDDGSLVSAPMLVRDPVCPPATSGEACVADMGIPITGEAAAAALDDAECREGPDSPVRASEGVRRLGEAGGSCTVVSGSGGPNDRRSGLADAIRMPSDPVARGLARLGLGFARDVQVGDARAGVDVLVAFLGVDEPDLWRSGLHTAASGLSLPAGMLSAPSGDPQDRRHRLQLRGLPTPCDLEQPIRVRARRDGAAVRERIEDQPDRAALADGERRRFLRVADDDRGIEGAHGLALYQGWPPWIDRPVGAWCSGEIDRGRAQCSED